MRVVRFPDLNGLSGNEKSAQFSALKITEVSEEQSAKAPLRISVTFSPIMTEVRPEQSEYLLLVDYQYYTL